MEGLFPTSLSADYCRKLGKKQALFSSMKEMYVLSVLCGRVKEEKASQTLSHDLLTLDRLDMTFNLAGYALIRTESH